MIPTGLLAQRVTIEARTGGRTSTGQALYAPATPPLPANVKVRTTVTAGPSGPVLVRVVKVTVRPGVLLEPGDRIALPDGTTTVVETVQPMTGPTGRPDRTVAVGR